MKLLLVEDEEKLIQALSYLLRKNGFTVDTARDGKQGLEMACTGAYDAIVLDRSLPHLDGLSLLRALRSRGLDTLVLILTGNGSLQERIAGLDAGADDYMEKPFYTEELLARLRSLTRRRNRKFVGDIIEAAGLVLDPRKRHLTNGTESFLLTAKESSLLELLMSNCNRVITKKCIFEKVWGINANRAASLASVDLYIHYLRRKLNIAGIRTIRGIGYALQEADSVSEATH